MINPAPGFWPAPWGPRIVCFRNPTAGAQSHDGVSKHVKFVVRRWGETTPPCFTSATLTTTWHSLVFRRCISTRTSRISFVVLRVARFPCPAQGLLLLELRAATVPETCRLRRLSFGLRSQPRLCSVASGSGRYHYPRPPVGMTIGAWRAHLGTT